MSHIASTSQTSVGLRLTLQQLESDDSLDSRDPAFVDLKRRLLLRLMALGIDSVAEEESAGTESSDRGEPVRPERLPIPIARTECKRDHAMTIHIALHLIDDNVLLFDGLPAECPPIPRVGEEIVHEKRRLRLEGICYHYMADHLEIGLLA